MPSENWWNGQSLLRTVSYGYDADGRLTSASDPDGTLAFAYNARGLLAWASTAGSPYQPAVTLASSGPAGYDAAGHRTQLAATVAGNADFTTDYAYDDAGRLTRITQSDPGVAEKRIDFGYLKDTLKTVTRYADLAGTQQAVKTRNSYDPAGRLKAVTRQLGNGPEAGYLNYTWDNADRLTAFVTPDGTANYAYDNADQLLSAGYTYQAGENFAYDANGNRTSPGYQTAKPNRLVTDGVFSYLYDAEGNRTQQTRLSTNEVTSYEYDHRNRLTHVQAKANGGSGPPVRESVGAAVPFPSLASPRRAGIMTGPAWGGEPGSVWHRRPCRASPRVTVR